MFDYKLINFKSNVVKIDPVIFGKIYYDLLNPCLSVIYIYFASYLHHMIKLLNCGILNQMNA